MMNDVLALPKSELLINLMWYRINMDMTNDAVVHHVTELFGDENWRSNSRLCISTEQRGRRGSFGISAADYQLNMCVLFGFGTMHAKIGSRVEGPNTTSSTRATA